VNAGELGRRGHRLDFLVAETFGEEQTSILMTADLWKKNISAYVGPQETCIHEGRMAAAFNIPMISYVSKLIFIFNLHIRRVFLNTLHSDVRRFRAAFLPFANSEISRWLCYFVHASHSSTFRLQFCTHQETSDKNAFPTFARTRPPDMQISKSVTSVLLAFNFTKVSIR
jgi:hypothetical protein